jgi:hypothetical protein
MEGAGLLAQAVDPRLVRVIIDDVDDDVVLVVDGARPQRLQIHVEQ